METTRRERSSRIPPIPERSNRHRPRAWTIAVLSALAVGAAACTSVSASSTGDSVDDAKLIQVPDVYTPVVMASLSAPTFPFLGTDGKYHVAYDLELTNASRVPATIDKLEVVERGGTEAGDRLVLRARSSSTRPVRFGDCNRLRPLPSAPADEQRDPAAGVARRSSSTSRSTPSTAAPKAVLHHLFGEGAVNPGAGAGPDRLPRDAVRHLGGHARVIGPPVRGKNWIALNGCCCRACPTARRCLAQRPPRQRPTVRHRLEADQRPGRVLHGRQDEERELRRLRPPIYAVADGTVISTLDGHEANAPGVLPADDPVLGPKLTVENVDGNHIVLDIGDGV